jgi:hypothetical protein
VPSEAEIVESAITAIEGILKLPILKQHKYGLIDGMIWTITQARGKYTTRYRSRAALDAPKGAKLQHEHVTTRKHLVNSILQHPERAREIAARAVGCVITKEEHQRLTRITREQPHLTGWQRYEAAGIEVVDTDGTGTLQAR